VVQSETPSQDGKDSLSSAREANDDESMNEERADVADFIDSSSLASRADERLSLPSCEGVSDRSKGGPYESEEFRLGPEAG
jgi:hypothetical protein